MHCLSCGSICVKIAEARSVRCGSIQRLSLPEKMPGLQLPGGPPVSFKSPTSHGYPFNVSHHLFHFSKRICLSVLYEALSGIILTFSGVINRVRWVLTTMAVTKKHGCSAESPDAARRASVQSVPLDGYGDSRGCSVATRKPSGRENACNNTF